jgi:hypothetical protein
MPTDTSHDKLNMMQTLVKVEETTGRLYEAYGRIFPEHEEFWFGLTMEEADHASAILDLINMYRNGKANFYEDSKLIAVAENLLSQLENELKQAEQGPLSFNDALSRALNIEKSLAEHRFYRMFGGSSRETLSILELLDSSSNNHVNVLQTELKHHHDA